MGQSSGVEFVRASGLEPDVSPDLFQSIRNPERLYTQVGPLRPVRGPLRVARLRRRFPEGSKDHMHQPGDA